MSSDIIKSCLANLNIKSKIKDVHVLCEKKDPCIHCGYGSTNYLIGDLNNRYIAVKHWSGCLSDNEDNTYDIFNDYSSAEQYLVNLGGKDEDNDDDTAHDIANDAKYSGDNDLDICPYSASLSYHNLVKECDICNSLCDNHYVLTNSQNYDTYIVIRKVYCDTCDDHFVFNYFDNKDDADNFIQSITD